MLRQVDALMPIGEFSDRSGLSPKRLRSYAEAGLLVPAAVDSSSGYRYYSPDQLRDARVIDALRRAGLPLADIATVLRDPCSERLEQWARQVEAEAEQRHDALLQARLLLRPDGPSGDSRFDRSERSGKEHFMKLRSAARTETGPVRERNEDTAVCRDHLVMVADGMGGHAGGDRASSLAAAVLEAAFTGQSADELSAGVRAANRAVFEQARSTRDLRGMGTTVCAAGVTREGELVIAHVGDSRAYLVSDRGLERLTDDHTVTAQLVSRGELTDEEAGRHPHRSILTRAVGIGPEVDVDTVIRPAVPGDRVLLCTDGLSNAVPTDEMLALLETADGLDGVADALVDQALSRGGHDNVTVVVAEVCP